MHKPTEWYVYLCGEPIGPLTIGTVTRMLKEHRLSWFDYVWSPALKEWTAVHAVADFEDLIPAPPEIPIPGRETPKTEPATPPRPSAWVQVSSLGTFPITRLTPSSVSFRTSKDIPVNMEIQLVLSSEGKINPLELTGLLFREQEDEFMIEFTRLNPSHAKQLENYLSPTRKR